MSYPVAFTAELRGVVPASTFKDRDTGDLVNLAPALQLEAHNEDGSVVLHQVRLSDKLDTELKAADLVRGLQVNVNGEAVMSDNSSYFRYLAVAAA